MNPQTIQDQLHVIGFRPSTSEDNHYFIDINGYNMFIDFDKLHLEKSVINYGTKIQVHHSSICNFEKPENLVQLECVIRLLKKGYKPKDIQLEKTFPLGRRTKGRLDIFITHNNKCLAMIECKTAGEEYNNELQKVLTKGGQIFSYFAQDRNAEIMGIYTSIIADSINFQSEQILTKELDKSGNAQTIHESWTKSGVGWI